jgi:DNA-binding XRE family transcriptional regulator
MRKRKILREIVVDPEAETILPLVVDSTKTPNLAPGELLRLVRTTLRMTQEQLAKRSGIVQAHIARMEAGRVDGQWKTWVKLFEALQCRLVLRLQAEGGVGGIIESRIHQTAQLKVAWGEKMFPDPPLSDAERQEELAEWVETLQNRRTSDIWEEETL